MIYIYFNFIINMYYTLKEFDLTFRLVNSIKKTNDILIHKSLITIKYMVETSEYYLLSEQALKANKHLNLTRFYAYDTDELYTMYKQLLTITNCLNSNLIWIKNVLLLRNQKAQI